MKHFFAFILFLLTFNLFSQTPPDTLWTQTFGGSGDDKPYSLQQAADGGYIIAGTTTSYGAGGTDFWLIKTDENGNEEWNHAYGGSGWEVANSVQQATDGGYIVVGWAPSVDGHFDSWLVKVDESGNEEWTQTYGGTGSDLAYSVQQTVDEGYIIAGITSTYGAGYRDCWLIKTDEYGNEEWNQTYGGSGDDEAYSVQQTADGGYIIAGSTSSFGAGGKDFWLVKTDNYGNENWNQTYGGSDYDLAFSVQQTDDGGYIVAGFTSSYGAGSRDFWLVKTDNYGNEDWNQTYGGSYSEIAWSVHQTIDGGYIAAGYTNSYGVGVTNFWLLKTDENGNENWAQTYGGIYSDVAMSVQQTTDEGFVVAGRTTSYGAGETDMLVIRLSAETDYEDDVVSIEPFQ